MKRKLCKNIWISSLASVLLLITLPSSEGHWTDAFATRLFVDFDYDFKEVLMEKNLKDPRSFGFDSGAYGLREEHPGFQPYVLVWESEVRYMAAQAARWGNIETGGEVYGLLSHAGRPVIMLATPPGPEALNEVFRFRQDMDFFKKVNAFLNKYFGLQYLGNYHSHHNLNIKGLSEGDVQSTNAIASKNGFRRFAQFVVTFEKERPSGFPSLNDQVYGKVSVKAATESETEGNCFRNLYASYKARFTPSRQISFIRIQSYIYLDAPHGKPIRCPLRVLRGTSPFRRAILRNSIIPELAAPYYSIPMDRILYEFFHPPDEPGDRAPELPARISNECLQLPEDVRENTRVAYKEGLIVISLPLLLAKGTVFVGYNDKPPHKVEGVYFSQNGKAATPIELSKEALWFGPYTGLARIYERVVRLVEGEGSTRRPENSRGTSERVRSREGDSNKQEVVNGRKESEQVGNEEVL